MGNPQTCIQLTGKIMLMPVVSPHPEVQSVNTIIKQAGPPLCVKPYTASVDPASPARPAMLLLAQPTKCQEGMGLAR